MSLDLVVLLLGAVALSIVVWVLNRKGPGPRPPRAGGASGPLVAMLLALSLLGCGGAITKAKLVVGGAASLYNLEQPRLEAAEKVALDGCLRAEVPPLERPTCVDKVIDGWAPVKQALVALDGAIHAARGALLIADAASVTGAPVDVEQLGRQVAEVLNAAMTLQRLTAPRSVAPPLPGRVLPSAAAPSPTPAPAPASPTPSPKVP